MNILLLVREADSLADWFFFLIVRLKTRRVTEDLLPVRMNSMWEQKRQHDPNQLTQHGNIYNTSLRVELAGGDQVLVLLHRRSLKTHIHRPFAELASAPSLNNDSCRETLPALYGCIPYPFFPLALTFDIQSTLIRIGINPSGGVD
jgi:hypothetical protein